VQANQNPPTPDSDPVNIKSENIKGSPKTPILPRHIPVIPISIHVPRTPPSKPAKKISAPTITTLPTNTRNVIIHRPFSVSTEITINSRSNSKELDTNQHNDFNHHHASVRQKRWQQNPNTGTRFYSDYEARCTSNSTRRPYNRNNEQRPQNWTSHPYQQQHHHHQQNQAHQQQSNKISDSNLREFQQLLQLKQAIAQLNAYNNK
jgi:hypothetical protein